MKTNNPPIIPQDQALSNYMDSLFDVSEDEDFEENNAEKLEPAIENKSPRGENNLSAAFDNEELPPKQAMLKKDEQNNILQFNTKAKIIENNLSTSEQDIKTTDVIKQINTEEPIIAKEILQKDDLVKVNDQEAPSLDLSLFLPKVPSIEELDIIEKKEQIEINHNLKRELEKTKESNVILKGQLQESLKKLDDYGKTHTEVYAPDWAQPSFQVMIFNVGNLKLAVPLNDLNGIVVWDEKFINKMPGSVDWHLGIIQHLGKSVPVIDTLQQVIPPERVKSFMKKRGEFKNIIFIHDDSWGLVCEDIIGIKTISVEEVKWRSTRTTRRWLYGTVKEYMCALLDTEEFATMLRTGKDSLIVGKTN